MNNIYKFNEIINYIEENLTSDISVDEMAKSTFLSVYEFRRVFSFIVGIPIGEYIRNRRLSTAAEDILNGKTNITELALKYGYENSSSFTRAFKAFHSVAPTELLKNNKKIKMYTKIGLDFCINGGSEIEYKIIEDSHFYIVGYTENSNLDDTECCENVWENFYKSENYLNFDKSDKIFASYINDKNNVRCTIGKYSSDITDKNAIYIPKTTWACFTLKGTTDSLVNSFYTSVVYKFFNSSAYKRADMSIPNLEIFPADMTSDDFEWEIRIPIVPKNNTEIFR